jgi:hypothetical protein
MRTYLNKNASAGFPGVCTFDYVAVGIPFWWIALASAVYPAIALRRRYVLERRAITGHCLACGYDLRASTDRCPECGTAIDHSRKLASP